MIDYALRASVSLKWAWFWTRALSSTSSHLKNETFNDLLARWLSWTRKLCPDRSLGRGFCIGAAISAVAISWAAPINGCRRVVVDILPMGEYWFDDQEKYQRWENILHGVFQWPKIDISSLKITLYAVVRLHYAAWICVWGRRRRCLTRFITCCGHLVQGDWFAAQAGLVSRVHKLCGGCSGCSRQVDGGDH